MNIESLQRMTDAAISRMTPEELERAHVFYDEIMAELNHRMTAIGQAATVEDKRAALVAIVSNRQKGR